MLSKDIKAELDTLLHKESETRYQLTLIKRPIQNFSNKQATVERKKRDDLERLFEAARLVFQEIKMSHLSIKYFAQLVDRYTIQQLKQFHDIKRYFYILCFVYYKYLKINDDLVKTFLHFVSKYKGEVKIAVKDKMSQMRIKNTQNMSHGAKIFRLLTGKDIDGHDVIKLFRKKAYKILPKNKINKLALYMERSDLDYESFRWLEYDSKFSKIRRNLRHLFKSLALTTNNKKSIEPLFEAMTYLKSIFHNSRQKKTSDAPAKFIPRNLKKHIYKKEKNKKPVLDKERYETLVYSMLKNKIDSSDVFVHDSLEYRSLESDILDLHYFTKNKNKICKTLGTEFLNTPLEILLKRKMEVLETLIHETNRNILTNKNAYFKFKNKKNSQKWYLDYKGIENKEVNNPLFKKLPRIDLVNLIWLVNKKTGFFSTLTHALNKNASLETEAYLLIAVIIAYATNLGLSKMAACSNLSYPQLKRASDTFFSPHTLKSANEVIINATVKLPIQKIFNINHTVHSSIDGKKYESHDNIFNARYSSKYFGMNKGISVMTLDANFLPLAIKIVSPNEYEGNFGLELLLMNESDIQPLINSTDTHGINEINYALYDCCGYDFQPRYRNIYEKAQIIHSPKSPNDYAENYIIKPTRQIKTQLILDEEFHMKRIIASILSKTCTVSTIVKKLSSSMKSNKTRKAFAEYNKILRTTHILRTINNLKYRQNIMIALNRGESYHFLASAVSFANAGRILAKTEQEQLVSKECSRLVCTMIIYYNSFILSQYYEQKMKLKQHKQIEALKHVSPIAWVNVNLYGKYELKNISSRTSFNKIIEMIKNEVIIDDYVTT